MKLRGQIIQLQNTRTVEIRDGMELTITALPLGFESRASVVFPTPKPPQKYAEGPGGKILRDPNTKKPVLVDDTEDKAWQEANRIAQRRQMMFVIWKALEGEDIEWNFTKNHSDPTNPEFVDAMFDELRDTGFTMGDLAKLMEATVEASALKAEEVDEATEGF